MGRVDGLESRTGGPLFPVRVLAFAAAVPLLLRVVKLPRLGEWLEPEEAPSASSGVSAEALTARIDRLLKGAWPVVRRGCLVRGLTLYRFLREAGVDVSLCFGMGRPDGEEDFTGHCWIEMDGRALAEKRDPKPIYTETFRIAPRRRPQPPATARTAGPARPETA